MLRNLYNLLDKMVKIFVGIRQFHKINIKVPKDLLGPKNSIT